MVVLERAPRNNDYVVDKCWTPATVFDDAHGIYNLSSYALALLSPSQISSADRFAGAAAIARAVPVAGHRIIFANIYHSIFDHSIFAYLSHHRRRARRGIIYP